MPDCSSFLQSWGINGIHRLQHRFAVGRRLDFFHQVVFSAAERHSSPARAAGEKGREVNSMSALFFAIGLVVLVGGSVLYAMLTPEFARAAGVNVNR